jgi:RNA polymerase sigma factor (sigma-70 family)
MDRIRASDEYQETDVRTLTLAGIAHRCTQETERYFRRRGHDPRYCFELFRRAIVDRDQRAWEHVYAQYRPLVIHWVRRHSAFPGSGEEAPYFVNRAFEKMWTALTPAKFDRFRDLSPLLRYLQMCVHSAILDQVRAAEQRVVDAEAETMRAGEEEDGAAVEAQALARVRREELWRAIDARLHDEKERCVVYGSFVLALKPRELCAQYRDTFRDVREVYRVKENVLARLRRDAELARLFGQDA